MAKVWIVLSDPEEAGMWFLANSAGPVDLLRNKALLDRVAALLAFADAMTPEKWAILSKVMSHRVESIIHILPDDPSASLSREMHLLAEIAASVEALTDAPR